MQVISKLIYLLQMNQSTSRGSLALDQSNHSLNKSSSKQKYSFPKSNRFSGTKPICDSFYEIPSTRISRGTSFGYGIKDMGIRNHRYAAEPASYRLNSQFQEKKRGTSFGPGRQEMALGGPMKNAALQKYIPGPGQYQKKSTLDHAKISIKPRLRDKSQDHLLKNPGPGTYTYEQIGKDKYYITSRHKNETNFKIPPPQAAKVSKTLEVGPGRYETNHSSLSKDGKYVLSKNKGSQSRQFTKSPRQSIVYKHILSTPGPQQYSPFTYFGPG